MGTWEHKKRKKMTVRIPLWNPNVIDKKNTKTSITDAQKITQTKKLWSKVKEVRAKLLKLGYKNPSKYLIDKHSVVFDYDKVFK